MAVSPLTIGCISNALTRGVSLSCPQNLWSIFGNSAFNLSLSFIRLHPGFSSFSRAREYHGVIRREHLILWAGENRLGPPNQLLAGLGIKNAIQLWRVICVGSGRIKLDLGSNPSLLVGHPQKTLRPISLHLQSSLGSSPHPRNARLTDQLLQDVLRTGRPP